MKNKKTLITMIDAQNMFIGQLNRPFEFGSQVSSEDLPNFIVDALFPKMKAQHSVTNDIRNKFSRFIQLVPSAGEIIEVYGLLDLNPVELGLDESGLELFKNNFAEVVALQYTNQVAKKAKITLELKETRKRFMTGGNALVDYIAVNEATLLNGIARTEQEEILQMWVQYYKEKTLVNHRVSTINEASVGIAKVMLDVQDNVTNDFNQVNQISDKYQNADYTVSTDLEDVYILTTNDLAAQISVDIFPQYFDTKGIDFRDRLLSFRKFPQVITTTREYTLTQADIALLSKVNYLVKPGTVIKEGTMIPNAWYRKGFASTEEGLFEVYEFDNNLFAFIFDKQCLLYAWDEGAGYTNPFQNPDNLTIQMYYHYTSLKAITPFYNIATMSVGAPPTKPVDTP